MSSSYDAPDWVPRKRVAIVGGGAAGIAALYALNRTHHDAYLYEAADRLGGHANTVEWKRGKFRTVVDTGFMVFNAKTSRSWDPPPLLFDRISLHKKKVTNTPRT